MSPPAASNAEVVRRLDELGRRLDRLVTALEEGYVRKDVQEVREIATGTQLKGLEDEQHSISKRIEDLATQRDRERDERDKQRAADRRLLYTLAVSVFLGPVVVALLLHALAIG